jgi:hypothetical protein
VPGACLLSYQRDWTVSFSNPEQLSSYNGQNVFVADYGNNRVQKYDSSGNWVANFGSVGVGNGQFQGPLGVAETFGKLYVADSGNNRIQILDPSTGAYLGQWGSSGTGPGQFQNPVGLAVDTSNGDVFVVDDTNSRVQIFDANGTFISQFGSSGTGNGQFSYPTSIAFDKWSQDVLVVDNGNARVERFDANGTYLSQWGSYGSADWQFQFPDDIALDDAGNVFVTDQGDSAVKEFTSTGVFEQRWGTYGSGSGQFLIPSGILLLGYKIEVADWNGNRIEEFSCTGPSITPSPSSTSSVTPSFTQTATASGTASQTPSASLTATASGTATHTQVLTPTLTPTISPVSIGGPLIADFENGLQSHHNGSVLDVADPWGSTLTSSLTTGCPYGSSPNGWHCSGTVVQDTGNSAFARTVLQIIPGGNPAICYPFAPGHALIVTMNNSTPGAVYRLCLPSSNITDGDYYCVTFTASVGWQDIYFMFPDVTVGPNDLQLRQAGFGQPWAWNWCVNLLQSVTIEPAASTSGPVSFDFSVDDVVLAQTMTRRANPLTLASAFGLPLATVLDAQSLNLGDYATWIILDLAAHCGCSPHTVYALRGSMSWGQICASYGLSWPTVLAETEGKAATAGLQAAELDPSQAFQDALNQGAVLPTATPAPYLPSGQFTPAPSSPGCPP